MLGTASGGVIGLLIGIIGGPLGMLIGGAGGLYAGALFDFHDAGEMESALAGMNSPWPGCPGTKFIDDDADRDPSNRTNHQRRDMTPSDKMKDQDEKAWTNQHAHLTTAEDHLEAAARKAERSFEEHTAVPEAHLEKTEDYLEAVAHKAETQAADRDAQVRERISHAQARVGAAPVVAARARPADQPCDPPAPPPVSQGTETRHR